MSTAKNFLMIGLSGLYHENHDEFAKRISDKTRTNIKMAIIHDYESEDGPLKADYKSFDFGYKFETQIRVEYYKEEQHTTKIYTVALSINHYFEADKILELDFQSNDLVWSILPNRLLSGWIGLIEGLKGDHDQYFSSHKAFIDALIKERETYRKDLLKMGLQEIIFFPDGRFDFEYCEDFPKTETMNDFLNLIKDLDDVQIFELAEIIRQSLAENLSKKFTNSDPLKTIFVDNLQPFS
jgi:hypothetical protein